MTMRELSVYVGNGLDALALKEVLAARSGALLKDVAHAVLDEHSDDRAVITSVAVERVTVDTDFPSQVEVEFETSWNVYKGCEDKNLSGCEVEVESATYTADGNLVFMVPVLRKHAEPC